MIKFYWFLLVLRQRGPWRSTRKIVPHQFPFLLSLTEVATIGVLAVVLSPFINDLQKCLGSEMTKLSKHTSSHKICFSKTKSQSSTESFPTPTSYSSNVPNHVPQPQNRHYSTQGLHLSFDKEDYARPNGIKVCTYYRGESICRVWYCVPSTTKRFSLFPFSLATLTDTALGSREKQSSPGSTTVTTFVQ